MASNFFKAHSLAFSIMAGFSTLSALTRRLEGKVALVTGGATGIGECTAKLFSQHGAKVAIADVRPELGQSVVEQIGASNSRYIQCDVTDEDQIRNAVDETVSAYGKLDIMINNAGIADPPKPRIADNEKADFERVLAVNVTGVFLGSKHAARVMIPARRGAIISMASLASGIGGGATHAYTSSKHAVVGLTRNLAVELGQFGIRVNCLSPYACATDLSKKYLELDDEALEEAMRSMANLKGDDFAEIGKELNNFELAGGGVKRGIFEDGILQEEMKEKEAMFDGEGYGRQIVLTNLERPRSSC